MGGNNSTEQGMPGPIVNPRVPFNPRHYQQLQQQQQQQQRRSTVPAPSPEQQRRMQEMIANGLQPDIALRPFQMPRVPNEPPRAAPVQQQTIRLKNDFNLHKTSLSLAREGSKVTLQFEFDTTVPCLVRVYFLATEIVDQKNTTLRFEQRVHKHEPLIYRYPSGSGQRFRQPIEHSLDLSQFTVPQLLYTSGSRFFPIVIALLRDDGLQETHSEPGPSAVSSPPPEQTEAKADGLESKQAAPYDDPLRSPQQTSPAPSASPSPAPSSSPPSTASAGSPANDGELRVQSQFTFATFTRRPDKVFDVRVIKQKIQVEGFAYELQEIYGLSASVQNDTPPECVVCLTNPRCRTLLPCRHLCLCGDCAEIVRVENNRCPVCRSHIESVMDISVAQTNPRPQPSPTYAQLPPAGSADSK